MKISHQISNIAFTATLGALTSTLLSSPIGATGGALYGVLVSTLGKPLANFCECDSLTFIAAPLMTLSATWALMKANGFTMTGKDIIVLHTSMMALTAITGLGMARLCDQAYRIDGKFFDIVYTNKKIT